MKLTKATEQAYRGIVRFIRSILLQAKWGSQVWRERSSHEMSSKGAARGARVRLSCSGERDTELNLTLRPVVGQFGQL